VSRDNLRGVEMVPNDGGEGVEIKIGDCEVRDKTIDVQRIGI